MIAHKRNLLQTKPNISRLKGRRRLRHRNSRWQSWTIFTIVSAIALLATGGFALAKAPVDDATKGPIIGIDLGTTYSVAAVYQNGAVEILQNDQGNRITPSYVAFTDTGGRLVGDSAKNQATSNPHNTIFDVKRLIGREFSDPTVQADKKLVPFQILSDNNSPAIQVTVNNEEKTFTPEQISSMVLKKMKETAESFLGQEVTRAVVTVPAYFNDAQKQATKDAGTIAGLKVERILTEPTAAAMAYGIDKKGGESNILVFDLGGGTFDVSVLSIDDGVFEVLSTNGDTHLGGEDFDQRVMQYFVKLIQKKEGVDISKDALAMQKLRKEAERVKRALSSNQSARVEIENLSPGISLSETLTRARFEEINSSLFRGTLGPVKQALKDADLTIDDIDEIVLVGGSTRIPKIREIVSDYFGGKQPVTGVNPDESVAFGAALQGGILAGESGRVEEMIIIDSTPLTTGIETVGGVMTKLLPRGTTFPTKKSRKYSGL